ncbi:homoserine dehydrogenase [Candidatus Sumerlaeota bacterium]|nr:homoserine dehydrogenase [Candidatus Sumerlaeota bacterium]
MGEPFKIGLIGLGNIGTGVINALRQNGETIAARIGRPLEITRIADKDTKTDRGIELAPGLLTDDVDGIFNDPEIGAVIELVGGVEPARTFCEKALKSGKHVVTANKALLAAHLCELRATAKENNVCLLYEASVGGAIPLIRSLQQGLAACQVQRIAGILNGTCNFILTQMITEGLEFDEALKQAQELGYAEPDPTLDIEGIDTAHKLAVLASLAFGQTIQADDVYCEGITKLEPLDIAFAAASGFAVKLLGIAQRHDNGAVEARVHPAFVPVNSMLASVRSSFNAALIDSDLAGSTMLYGRGAGPLPTASAILGDIIAVAQECGKPSSRDDCLQLGAKKNMLPMDQVQTAYFVRIGTNDPIASGSAVATEMAKHGVHIQSYTQAAREDSKLYDVLLTTEKTREGSMQAALNGLRANTKFIDAPVAVRIEQDLLGMN